MHKNLHAFRESNKTKRPPFDYIWRSLQPTSLLKQGNMEPIGLAHV